MPQRIGMGLVGPGFIAQHHIDAVRRLGDVDVVAIAGSTLASAQRKAKELKIESSYGSFEELVNDPAIHVVHNTTPSYLHVPVTLAAIRARKHVISDKPLAMTARECAVLRDAAAAAGVVNAVTFNYRGDSMVQEARVRIAAGEAGELVSVHGQYLQDWMTDANVYSWRMDPVKGGVSSALAGARLWPPHRERARRSHDGSANTLRGRRLQRGFRSLIEYRTNTNHHSWRRSCHCAAALRQ